MTFKSLFAGNQSRLEEKILVDDGLLFRLREYGIITEYQRRDIEVLLFANCRRIVNHNLDMKYVYVHSFARKAEPHTVRKNTCR